MEDCDSPASMQSIFHVRASELYPKRELVKDHEHLSVPFTTLCGEGIEYLGCTADGILALSNYRLYHELNDSTDYSNIPLGLIETIEVKDIIYLHISCKDAKVCRCTFNTSEQCLEWYRRLTKAISPSKSTEELFAFAIYAWVGEEGGEEVMSRLNRERTGAATESFYAELERLKFDISEGGPWRVTTVNKDHRICLSYPRHLLVPACITDEGLEAASRFRSSRRLPAVVWRHRGNGAVIARCSQPEVGLLGWRSTPDEDLIKAIRKACRPESTGDEDQIHQKLLIIDARSYASAFTNRARGGGFECPEYYPNCEILWMSLANIHSIRKSFYALRNLCSAPPDHPNWFSMLETSRWLHNMAGLMQAAATVASAIERDARPVLVHCSDGWDRTPQIVSIAEILLDPYYRTIEGFKTLVEREWLEFGHKFADRCGQTEELNERCPVFLQFLDIIHQLVKQFPCAFEFSISYLIKLARHTYSNMFGTFLCNSSRERSNLGVQQQTFSVWSFLQGGQYINHLFACNDQVLWPSCNVRDLEVWRELYLEQNRTPEIDPMNVFAARPGISDSTETSVTSVMSVTETNTIEEFMNGEDHNGNGEEQNGNSESSEILLKPEEKKTEDLNIFSESSKLNAVFNSQMNGLMEEGLEGGLTSVVGDSECARIEKLEVCADEDWRIESDKTVDHSVESSTETLVAFANVSECHTATKNQLINSLSGRRPAEISNTDVPKTTGRVLTTLLDPVDGLAPFKDDVQIRLQQMVLEHKAKELALERELHTTRLALLQQVCHQCIHTNNAERPDDDGSVCSTEVSWEAVEEQEVTPTLWVPDHAVSHCMGCHNQFWLGRRKHHCRSCGKIFCADCSENTVALPEEQLYEPVRVCATCYNNPLTTCKQQAQAAGREGQNGGVVLPPAHT